MLGNSKDVKALNIPGQRDIKPKELPERILMLIIVVFGSFIASRSLRCSIAPECDSGRLLSQVPGVPIKPAEAG